MNLPNISALRIGTGVDTSKFTTMVAPAGAIIVSVIILLFIVWPKFTSVLSIRSANRELAVRSQSLSQKVELLSSLDKIALTSDIGYAEQLLPSDKAVFSIITQLESAASTSGVVLNKVDVAPGSLGEEETSPTAGTIQGTKGTEVAEAAPKLQLKVSLTSNYSSFLSFMNAVSTLARVTSVRDLTLSSSSAPGELAALRTNMIINAYWKPLPTKLGQIESPVNKLTEAEQARLLRVKSVTVSGAGPSNAVVPQVPTGRSDLFAPF